MSAEAGSERADGDRLCPDCQAGNPICWPGYWRCPECGEFWAVFVGRAGGTPQDGQP